MIRKYYDAVIDGIGGNTPEQSAIPDWFYEWIYQHSADLNFDWSSITQRTAYHKGAFAAAEELRSRQPIPSLRWVKASERLPEEGKQVVIRDLLSKTILVDRTDGAHVWYGGKPYTRTEWLEEKSLLPIQPHVQWLKDAIELALQNTWDGRPLGWTLPALRDELAEQFIGWLNGKKIEPPAPGQPSIEPDAPINDGWISVDTPPEIMKDQTYSENVFVVWEGKVEVMAHCSINDGEETGRVWCNCYGDINGEPQYDADYHPNLWRPIPKVPVNDELSPEAREAAAISARSLKYSLAKEKSDTDGLQS